MDVLVTGGTGFVGANLVRELIGDGHRVRVLARKGGDRRALVGCAVDIAEGDLLDVDSVRAAVAGARRVYHVAADYRLWAPDPRALYRANVDGTRHVLEAAALAGVERIVYTSTVGAVGIPKDGTPGDERTPVSLADMVGPYKASKFLAERVADELAARRGARVTVNPSAPIGPWDVKPTPTGQMVVDFLRGRMLGSLDTGLNVVHVRDVARGHIWPAERGRIGERYVLRHRNLSPLEIFRALSALTGVAAPRFRVPMRWRGSPPRAWRAWPIITGRSPAVPLTAVACRASACTSARPRRCASSAWRRLRWRTRCATRWTGSRRAATRAGRRGGARRERRPLRRPAHAPEPLELLLRLRASCPAPSATRSSQCTHFAASSTTSWMSATTARRSAASSTAGARRSPACSREPRSTPRASGSRRRCGASRSRAGRCSRSSTASRWTSSSRRTRRSTPCIRTATAWPRQSGSAPSRSSATATRRRATTRSTSGSRSSSRTSCATSRPTRGYVRVYLPQEDLRRFGVSPAGPRRRALHGRRSWS